VAFGLVDPTRSAKLVARFDATQPRWDQPASTAVYDKGRRAVGYWAPVGWAFARAGRPERARAAAGRIRAAAAGAGRRWPFTPSDAAQLIVLAAIPIDRPVTGEGLSRLRALLTLEAVSKRTGIPAATLRTWERRYRFMRPMRSPQGYRLYTEEDVTRILQVKHLLEQGVRVGEAAAALVEATGDDDTVLGAFHWTGSAPPG
jgi:MerR HTH family regulatory protein